MVVLCMLVSEGLPLGINVLHFILSLACAEEVVHAP